jgi:hypothetical protein
MLFFNSQQLETYKSECANKILNKSLEQASDEESFSNEAENQSMDLKSIGVSLTVKLLSILEIYFFE